MVAAKTVAVLYASKGSGMGDVGKFAALGVEGATVRVASLSAAAKEGDGLGIRPEEIDVTYAGGREALAEALSKLSIRRVDVGSADAPKQLDDVLSGADAVVSCLGSRQPFRERWIASGTQLVVDAMRRQNVDRLVALNSFGIGQDFLPRRGVIYYLWSVLLLNTFWLPAKRDLVRQEALVRDSGLDYLLVKPVGLTPELAPSNTWKVLTSDASSEAGQPLDFSIAKADVAAFMLQEALHPTLHRACATLGSPPSSSEPAAGST